MSKRIKPQGSKRSLGKQIKVSPNAFAAGDNTKKLSEIITEMAWSLLKNPSADASDVAAKVTVTLACAAWNAALGDMDRRDCHRELIEQFNQINPMNWEELRSADTDLLIAELIAFKQQNYPHDTRLVMITEWTPQGTVKIQWVVPAAHPEETANQTKGVENDNIGQKLQPIADSILRKLAHPIRNRPVNLSAFRVGKAATQELRKNITAHKSFREFHPAHAAYIYVQNQVATMAEQLLNLREMDPFGKLISDAEDEYMPKGPPMSPLTRSFFTCWTLFDLGVGRARETLATIIQAVGTTLGVSDEWKRLLGLMQVSRMGIYVHEGVKDGLVALRDLVTGELCRAVATSGYQGHAGELWYARVLPPPFPEMQEHVVFTTPYVLRAPDKIVWQDYFRRTLPEGPAEARKAAYEQHMKYGPSQRYWTEFVFEAFDDYRFDVIYLIGLPDAPESRPHSRVNDP